MKYITDRMIQEYFGTPHKNIIYKRIWFRRVVEDHKNLMEAFNWVDMSAIFVHELKFSLSSGYFMTRYEEGWLKDDTDTFVKNVLMNSSDKGLEKITLNDLM